MVRKMLLIRPKYLEMIRPYYDFDLIKVITGVRRSGKSRILEMIIQELLNRGVSNDHIVFMNFENADYDVYRSLTALNDYIKSKIVDQQTHYLFFDEIQHVVEFERALASFKATLPCSIFVTGSTSDLLCGQLATLLTGRTIEFHVLPFSYAEARAYRLQSGKPIPENFLMEYIQWGGFPQRFDIEDEQRRQVFLKQLYESILERDIFRKNPRVDKDKFHAVARYSLATCGKDFAPTNVAHFFTTVNQTPKIEMSRTGVYNYVDLLQKAYLLQSIGRYEVRGKAMLDQTEKFYAVDNGLRTIQTDTFTFEKGFFLENILFNEFLLRGYSVYVGKTYKSEIDFVVINQGKKCFVQVAYLLASEDVIAREFGAFSSIKDEAPKFVLSLDRFDFSRNGIAHLNIEDYLLGKKDLFFT